MISENFNKLLEIQMERYDVILKDCKPYVACDHEGDAVLHKRIVDDVTQLKSLTKEFMVAAKKAGNEDEKRAVLKSFSKAMFTSDSLWNYLYMNMGNASIFRKKALTGHAEIMGVIRGEQITTHDCISIAIGLDKLDEILTQDKPSEQDNKAENNSKRKPGPNLRIIK